MRGVGQFGTIHVESSKRRPLQSLHASLFQKLAFCILQRAFTPLRHARGNFPMVVLNGVTPLPDQCNFTLFIEGHNAAAAICFKIAVIFFKALHKHLIFVGTNERPFMQKLVRKHRVGIGSFGKYHGESLTPGVHIRKKRY
ncbi:MAG: hypothetical protein WC777_00780 [Candidatus Gracilibacteria bacterium]